MRWGWGSWPSAWATSMVRRGLRLGPGPLSCLMQRPWLMGLGEMEASLPDLPPPGGSTGKCGFGVTCSIVCGH